MTKGSATAERVPASDGESRRSAGLAVPMAELRDECPIATGVRDRSDRQTAIGRKCRGFARGRNMAGALRGDEAKRTLRRRTGFLPVAIRRRRMGRSETADDKAGWSGRRKSRHAEPDARHHRLDGKRIGDVNGQQAASRSRSDELSQSFHQRHPSTGPPGWRLIVGGTDRHIAVTLFTAEALPAPTRALKLRKQAKSDERNRAAIAVVRRIGDELIIERRLPIVHGNS